MAVVAIGWRSRKRFSFFNQQTITKYLTELRCISEAQQINSEFSPAGLSYSFRVFFTHNIYLDCCFDTIQEARLARRDLISRAILFWGKDQIIFSNGYEYDVIVVPAIRSLTDVFVKERHAGFAATVAGVPYPVHFVYPNQTAAERAYKHLSHVLESLRRFECKERFRKVAVG